MNRRLNPAPRAGRTASADPLGAVVQRHPVRPAHAFQSEHVLQMAVAQYLDRALPPDAWWTSIDSAGRGAIAGARMKRRGVKRGLPDILIIARSAGRDDRFTLWVELKSKSGRLTAEQEAFRMMAQRAGHSYGVFRSIEDIQHCLERFHVVLRAKVAA